MAILNFDAEAIEPTTDFEPLPVGDYVVLITASEIKTTKNGNGEYLQLTYDVVDGKYKGRKLFDRLNLKNQNQTAVEIAQRALSAICRAVGVMHPNDSAELHGKPLSVKVGIRPANGDYSASNEIKGWKSINGGTTLPTAAPTSAPAQTQNAPVSRGPWDRPQ